MPQGTVGESGGARGDHRAVELIGEPKRRGIILVQPQLVVRHPRWLVQKRFDIAEKPSTRKPPVRTVGGDQRRKARQQPLAGNLIVVEVEDPAAVALRVQPWNDRVARLAE